MRTDTKQVNKWNGERIKEVFKRFFGLNEKRGNNELR